jgi:hypothetical protein
MTGFNMKIRVCTAVASAIIAAESHAQTLHAGFAYRLTSQVMVGERPPIGSGAGNRSDVTSFVKTAESKNADPAADCPSNYPRTLPCIADGVLVYEEPSTGPRYPGILVLAYATDMGSLYSALEEAAEEDGWAIESSEIGYEADGRRYRAQLRKGPELVGVSIYTNPDGMALLQLMLWPVKETSR